MKVEATTNDQIKVLKERDHDPEWTDGPHCEGIINSLILRIEQEQAKGFLHGHRIYCDDGGMWRYKDNDEPTVGTRRNCKVCGEPPTPEGHDACLGTLLGVSNACCGHGQDADAYVQYTACESDKAEITRLRGLLVEANGRLESIWDALGHRPSEDEVAHARSLADPVAIEAEIPMESESLTGWCPKCSRVVPNPVMGIDGKGCCTSCGTDVLIEEPGAGRDESYAARSRFYEEFQRRQSEA